MNINHLLLVGLKRSARRQAFGTDGTRICATIRYNGADILNHIGNNEYSAIVLDWDLSRVPAYQVLAKAKSQGIPVVVVCESVVTAFGTGEPYADVYVEKPVKNSVKS